MSIKTSILFSLLSCLFFINVRAQDREIRFDHITVEDGLPESMIRSITQDSKGYLWMGTQGGLCRYDGYKVTVFMPDPGDPFSISNGYISKILEDKRRNIWIATNDGLNKYDWR